MNSTFTILIAIALYFIFYFTCGKHLEKNVVKADEDNETPAQRLFDGVDYVPANKYVLFGHHFASIAGAAPIVGPAIALAWGWLPGLLWVWFGNIFIGAVHDYLSLMSSVRYDGRSVQWIAGRIIKERTGYAFSWFVLFALILVVAAFGAVLGNIFVAQPAVPTAYFLKIIAALILGVLMYRVKLDFRLATIIGIAMLATAIYLGKFFPISLSYEVWMAVFFIYIVVAASIPVNILLQPRDYLNAWLLVTGLIIGGISLLIGFDTIQIPIYTEWSVPIIAGKDTPFWPVVPLIIACGSLSGFHSMVASGTTAKQLESEKQGLFIGYGAMFTEGFLSTIVIVSIGVFCYSIVSQDIAETLKSSPANFAEGYGNALKSAGGPVGMFSKSFATASHTALNLPMDFMIILASMWVSSFAMTTLDTTNRIARYAFSEVLEPVKEKAPEVYNVLSQRWVASAIPAGIGIALAWSGAWSVIWPAFGGANQMLASIALITCAVWVTKTLGNAGALNVLIPALFLWVTVTVALIWYMFVAIPAFMESNPIQAVILGIIMTLMILLNLLLIMDFFRIWREKPEIRDQRSVVGVQK